MNLVPARRRNDGIMLGDNGPLLPYRAAGADRDDLVLGVRPEDIQVAMGDAEPGRFDIPSVVEVVEPLGADTLVFTQAAGHPITVRVRPEIRPSPGDDMMLRLNMDRAHLFDSQTGRALERRHG